MVTREYYFDANALNNLTSGPRDSNASIMNTSIKIKEDRIGMVSI